MSILGTLPESHVCRPIDEKDFDAVMECLQRGFHTRSRRH